MHPQYPVTRDSQIFVYANCSPQMKEGETDDTNAMQDQQLLADVRHRRTGLGSRDVRVSSECAFARQGLLAITVHLEQLAAV